MNDNGCGHLRGSLLIGGFTFCLAVAISFLSRLFLSGVGFAWALLILFFIVVVGIVFDVIGVAATAGEEKPFHARAAKKISGAKEAVSLIRNADRVATFCCDIVGDICGTVSGAVGAIIVYQLLIHWPMSYDLVYMIIIALTAAFTVAGKAYGKRFGIVNSQEIIFFIGRLLSYLRWALCAVRITTNSRNKTVQ